MQIFSDETIAAIESKLEYSFNDKELLKKAFVHRSFFNENRDKVIEHNERLEFLGDAALGLIVSEYLFDLKPEQEEGTMSLMRSKMVDASCCAQYAITLGIDCYVLLGKGEKMNDGRGRESILADLFEALIGALFADGGFEVAKDFFLIKCLEVAEKKMKEAPCNYKALFQEVVQKKFRMAPTYQILEEKGPEHSKHFLVAVFVSDEKMGEGEGPSKKHAEQNAAKDALQKLGEEHGKA